MKESWELGQLGSPGDDSGSMQRKTNLLVPLCSLLRGACTTDGTEETMGTCSLLALMETPWTRWPWGYHWKYPCYSSVQTWRGQGKRALSEQRALLTLVLLSFWIMVNTCNMLYTFGALFRLEWGLKISQNALCARRKQARRFVRDLIKVVWKVHDRSKTKLHISRCSGKDFYCCSSLLLFHVSLFFDISTW